MEKTEFKKLDRLNNGKFTYILRIVFHIFIIFFCLGFSIISLHKIAYGDNSARKLTVMVYMCGSNLESLNGSASEDIQEMKDSGISNEISLLIMAGGSKSWSMGFDSSETIIYEISSRGSRIVKTLDKKNMGSSRTLTELLVYGKENRPAENYALILWNHGGGPLEGVCWDELFSGDSLNLDEVTEGIRHAELGKKLSWIGFDACLMSSLEVAAAMEPYAEYMIASQETEPVFGWNYAFLSGIESDSNGAETGSRIVDAYFDGQEENRDILTMSCTDLSKAAKAVKAMDNYFYTLSESVSEETFAFMSGARFESVGFGESVRENSNDGYDLVDAVGLVSNLDLYGESELQKLLRETVVYARSNREGANGLSLYHPYFNKEDYLNHWRDRHARLNFSPAYTQYIKNFGTILTGAEMVDWNGMETNYNGKDELGQDLITLNLTPEQSANVASARLLILGKSLDSYSLIFSSAASLEGNTITGYFSQKILYAIDQDGNTHGPLGYLTTPDGKYNVLTAVYYTENPMDLLLFSKESNKSKSVHFFWESYNQSSSPKIIRKLTEDEITGSMTNRLDISEDDYNYITFWDLSRQLPARRENTPLPGFFDWYDSPKDDIFHSVSLPNWELQFLPDIPYSKDMFAVFEVTDLQQNKFCSEPVLIPDDQKIPFRASPEKIIFDDFTAELSGSVYPEGILMEISIKNSCDHEANISFDLKSFVLNDKRIVNMVETGHLYNIYPKNYSGGETIVHSFLISNEDLLNLDRVETISFELTKRIMDENYTKPEKYTARFSIADCDVSEIVPKYEILAESEAYGWRIELIYLYTDLYENQIRCIIYVENNGDVTFGPDFVAALNGNISNQWLKEFPPGMSGICYFQFNNDLLSTRPDQSFFSNDYIILYDHIQQNSGFDKIYDIDFWMFETTHDDLRDAKYFSLHLNTPLPIQKDIYRFQNTNTIDDVPEGYSYEPLLLSENNQYRVDIAQLCRFEKALLMALVLKNKTDQHLDLFIDEPYFNDGSVKCSIEINRMHYYDHIFMPPDSVRILPITLISEDVESDERLEINSFSMIFHSDKQDGGLPVSVQIIDSPAPEPGEYYRILPGKIYVK